jgi:hypothetical protein
MAFFLPPFFVETILPGPSWKAKFQKSWNL